MRNPAEKNLSGEAVALDSLERDSFCIFINEHSEEKLSGGFYDQSYIPAGFGRKFDEYFAVTYLLEGRCRYVDYLKREYMLAPGALLIRHAGTVYSATGYYDERRHWLEFSAALPMSFFHALRAAGIIPPELTLLLPGVDSRLIAIARDYIDALRRAEDAAARARAYGLFLDFFSTAEEIARRTETAEYSEEERRMVRAREMLGANFEQELSPREAARRLGMGYESFRKKFARHVGSSPHDYRIRKRLEKADALLLHTRMPVKEIAIRLGYSAVSAFCRQYTSVRGYPPGTVRGNGNTAVTETQKTTDRFAVATGSMQ